MNSNITISFGGQSLTIYANKYNTYGDLLADANLRAILGFGDNVEPTVNGAVVDASDGIEDGVTVIPVTKAAKKA